MPGRHRIMRRFSGAMPPGPLLHHTRSLFPRPWVCPPRLLCSPSMCRRMRLALASASFLTARSVGGGGFILRVSSPPTCCSLQDIALLRISTTDKASVLVSAVPVNVTCKVVSGPGRLVGVGAGNPASHEQPNGDIVATVGGVARCLVQARRAVIRKRPCVSILFSAQLQVSLDCTSPARNRTISVDVDGNQRTTVLPEGSPCPEDPIVVQVVKQLVLSAIVMLSYSA